MHDPLCVDVVVGGPGGEAAVSRRSGAAIADGLRRAGHDVAVIDILNRLKPNDLRDGSVVFNIVHGHYGEDGALQAELDALGRVYVGSDSTVSARCMDKEATKRHLRAAGIRVPWGVVIDLRQPFDIRALHLPQHGGLVLKPCNDGSSVGLHMIPNPSFLLPAVEEILATDGPARYLVEERLPGPEYTVAVIDDAHGTSALPPLEIAAADEGVYDYRAKYERNDTRYLFVEETDLVQQLSQIAVAVHRQCGCRDLSRCDIMRSSDGGLAVLEVNTLPGFTDHSLVPKAADRAGWTFDQLVDHLVRMAVRRREV